MLTGVLFTTGCKDAVESALTPDCYTCTHATLDTIEPCEVLGGSTVVLDQYTGLDYSCTKR